MDCKIELIFVPVTDVDRAIDFYVEKVGFSLDIQARVDENTRFVQVTPPTSRVFHRVRGGDHRHDSGHAAKHPGCRARRRGGSSRASRERRRRAPRLRLSHGARSPLSPIPMATRGPCSSSLLLAPTMRSRTLEWPQSPTEPTAPAAGGHALSVAQPWLLSTTQKRLPSGSASTTKSGSSGYRSHSTCSAPRESSRSTSEAASCA